MNAQVKDFRKNKNMMFHSKLGGYITRHKPSWNKRKHADLEILSFDKTSDLISEEDLWIKSSEKKECSSRIEPCSSKHIEEENKSSQKNVEKSAEVRKPIPNKIPKIKLNKNKFVYGLCLITKEFLCNYLIDAK